MKFLNTLLFLGDVADDRAFGQSGGCKWEQNAVKSLGQSFKTVAERIDPLPRDFVSNTTTGFRPESAIHHAYAMGNAARLSLLSGIYQRACAAAEAAKRRLGHSVVCLMVTSNRLPLVKRAVRYFQNQSYARRELLVLDDGEDETGAFIASLGDPSIRHVRPDRPGLKLGELRNLAVKLAEGDYFLQWDDDDWYHPNRIKVQLAALQYAKSEFCLLSRWTLAWPARRLFCHSRELSCEGSVLGLRKAMPQYPEMACGEDSALVGALLQSSARVCFVDHPELYVHVVHGKNTHSDEHFANHIFNEHTGCLSGEMAALTLKNLEL